MSVSSTQMIARFVQQGVLTKEAAGRILEKRSRLFKQAGKEGMYNRAMGGAKGYSDIAGNILKNLAFGAGAAGTLAGGTAIINSRRNRALNNQIDDSYEQMLELNPELEHGKDREKVRRHFDTLRQFAPSVAANPIVAASVLEQTLTLGFHAPMLKELVQVQEGLDRSESNHSPLRGSMDAGLSIAGKAMGGGMGGGTLRE